MKYSRLSGQVMLIGLLAIFALTGCSGGGSDLNPSATNAGKGTVALFLKDGPADADEIWVSVTKVALIPSDADEGANDPVVIFESAQGEDINLLNYQNEPYLFFINDAVPSGVYAKIRLWIDDIWAVGGPCEEIEVKLPSNRIDLNPRGGFSVMPGETIAIALDVDLDKSIDMHEAGKSGKCIFRPVIFVDIYDHPAIMPQCPQMIAGTILNLRYNDDEAVIGFEMVLTNGGANKQPIAVSTEEALIFNGEGVFVLPEELQVGDEVKVRGRLNEAGALDAGLVVVGDVATVKGVAMGSVDESGIFELQPEAGQVVVNTVPVPVFLAPETLVLIGCNTEVARDAIQEGMAAVVIGKFDPQKGQILAVAVLLRPAQISGLLTAVEPVYEGSRLTIVANPDDPQPNEINLYLPNGVMPHVKGDGIIPIGTVMELVACKGRPVEVRLDPEDRYSVVELALLPDQISGSVVADTDPADDLLSLYDEASKQTFVIQVYAYATILNEEGSMVDLEAVKVGDAINSYGLESCENGIDQIAFVLSVQAAQQ